MTIKLRRLFPRYRFPLLTVREDVLVAVTFYTLDGGILVLVDRLRRTVTAFYTQLHGHVVM